MCPAPHADSLLKDSLKFKGESLSIPIDLLIYALRNKKVNQVRLFIGLKSLFNGQFKLDSQTIAYICSNLGYKSKKTLNANLGWLIKNKWVYFKKEYCIIRSFGTIKFDAEYRFSSCVIFKPAKDLNKFRPFTYATVIAFYKKLKGRKDRYTGTDERRSPYKRYNLFSSSYLPVAWLAKALNISKGSASGYKNEAARAGYLTVAKNYSPLHINNLKDDGVDYIRQYKSFGGDKEPHTLRVINEELFRQLPDIITSNMTIKRKRSLRKVS